MRSPDQSEPGFGPAVEVEFAHQRGPVLVVCEHASNHVPAPLAGLGAARETLESHAAWDPGALPLARGLAERLQAPLVAGRISRLVYDLNRDPAAPGAIPPKSEIFEIPGNRDLTPAARQARVDHVYHPFHNRLTEERQARPDLRALVTVHSFTPVYHGTRRAVEVGLLHGRDAQLAEAMLEAAQSGPFRTELNAPYGPNDGVSHMVDRHGSTPGLFNVMIEVRNDLLAEASKRAAIADHLAAWYRAGMAALGEVAR